MPSQQARLRVGAAEIFERRRENYLWPSPLAPRQGREILQAVASKIFLTTKTKRKTKRAASKICGRRSYEVESEIFTERPDEYEPEHPNSDYR